jgi:hypothetical protein
MLIQKSGKAKCLLDGSFTFVSLSLSLKATYHTSLWVDATMLSLSEERPIDLSYADLTRRDWSLCTFMR